MHRGVKAVRGGRVGNSDRVAFHGRILAVMSFETSKEYQKIFKFAGWTGNKLMSRESGLVEFKESFNWNSKDHYSKSLAGFANNKGGYIVFGVKDKPRELCGLRSNNFEDTDEATITRYLNSIFSPEIEFEKFVIDVRGQRIGILHVNEASKKPIIGIKNDGDIREGEIYYRYNARTEKIKFPELRDLMDQVREQERKQWMDLFQRASRIGLENAALLDVAAGKIEGKNGTIVIDQKLIPKLKFIQEGTFHEGGAPTLKLIGDVRSASVVAAPARGARAIRITDDPTAMAVREETILEKYPLSYAKLTEALSLRYKDFVLNGKFYALKKKFMADANLCHPRFLDPANPNSSRKDFYSRDIIVQFDKHYTKKT